MLDTKEQDSLSKITGLLVGSGKSEKAKKDLSILEKELGLLKILKEHPTYSIADLENLVEDYEEGKNNEDFDLYEYKFLYKYFGYGWYVDEY